MFSIIGMHIPQESQIRPEVYNTWKSSHPVQAEIFDALGLTSFFSSFIFITLVSLLFLNTFFCTRNMVIRAFQQLNRNWQIQKKPYIRGSENHTLIKTGKADREIISDITSILRSCGYKVYVKNNTVSGEKNRYGVLGVPLFHVSILIIILAVVYGSAGRMEGNMRLIEGQNLSEEHGNYMYINEGPFFHENHQRFDIKLEKFYPYYVDENGTPRGAAAELVILKSGREIKTDMVYSNHQMEYNGYTFLGNVYGLAPLLVLINPDGSIYSGSYITASDPDDSGRYAASFDIGDTGLEGELMVYMASNLKEILEPGNVKKKPVLFLRILDRGNEIYDGALRINDTVKIPGHEMYLGFLGIRYWSDFYVVKDDSVYLTFSGIGLLVVGLLINFFIIPKQVWAEFTDDRSSEARVYIWGRADKFRSLFEEEYSVIVDKIEKRLCHGSD